MPIIYKQTCSYCCKYYEGYGTKYCSYVCRHRAEPITLGKKIPKTVRMKISAQLKGRKLSPETRYKMSLSRRDEKHYGWRGDKASYSAIHSWVLRKKGKPTHCSNCRATNTGRNIHWSNRDHRYRRVLDDFIALCASCHKYYDLGHGLVNH